MLWSITALLMVQCLLVAGIRTPGLMFLPSLCITAAWLVGMMCLFICFEAVGVVYGNILQSTRGLISIVIGAHLAGLGMVHLEQKHPRHVVLRRLGAAAMMCAAIALYRISPQQWGELVRQVWAW